MSESAGLVRRVVAFAGLPFLSLLTPFLFLPLLARIAGADSWLAIAVGQSAGAFAALVISLGYNTVGPTLVARAAPADRPEVLRESLPGRLALAAPAAALAMTVAALVAPQGHGLEAALMALALALSGLSATWFMVGLGRVSHILGYDFAPRIVATAAASGLLVATGVVLWYPLLLIAAAIVGTLAYLLRTVGRANLRPQRGDTSRMLRANASAMAIELAGGAYNSLAVTFVGAAAAVGQAAAYVSGDKLYRMSQYAASALGNATQGWVVDDGGTRFAARARRALLSHGILGVLAFTAFATLGPWLTGLLFGAEVAIDQLTALGFGAASFGIAMGTGLGRVVLVGLGARRDFLICVLLGAAAGVPAILVLASLYGAAGGAWGLAIGELVSVTAQSIAVLRRWRRRAAVSD
ncbi:MAG: polysaccharide biosynthesis protein [Pseudolysinimonas sp.]|uniref:polysaccharide biosynthesis protein n=1 Tax=Pseudolysinimonas sp. TaxID=2680009 RepID=UPI003C75B5FB